MSRLSQIFLAVMAFQESQRLGVDYPVGMPPEGESEVRLEKANPQKHVRTSTVVVAEQKFVPSFWLLRALYI
jgi:hypothetical protein